MEQQSSKCLSVADYLSAREQTSGRDPQSTATPDLALDSPLAPGYHLRQAGRSGRAAVARRAAFSVSAPGRSSQGIDPMTISAKAEGPDSDLLDRALDLYRDLSLALRKTIDDLNRTAQYGGEVKGHQDLLRSHQKSLQSVLELEASLGQRRTSTGGGAELDLDAARAEIVARLARWTADR